MRSTKYDNNDELIEYTVSEPVLTIQASRKVGRENYGNEEIGFFLQVPLAPDADLADIEVEGKKGAAFLKTLVYEQLGLESTVDESGVVRDVPQAEKPKAAPRKATGARKSTGGGATNKDALWQEWVDNPSAFWDNRDSKRNPKAPDFKHKDNGEGLWIDKAPAFAKLVLDGEGEVI